MGVKCLLQSQNRHFSKPKWPFWGNVGVVANSANNREFYTIVPVIWHPSQPRVRLHMEFQIYYRESSLSTIFGTWQFPLVQFLMHSNSTSTNFIPIALKFLLVEIVLVETVLVGDPLYRIWNCGKNLSQVSLCVYSP